jgi:hypothetical protein
MTKSRMLMVSTMLPCIQTPSNFKFQYIYGVLVDNLALDRSICCNAHGSNNMGTQRNQVQASKLQMTPLQNFNIDARILETLVVIKNEFVPSPKSGRNISLTSIASFRSCGLSESTLYSPFFGVIVIVCFVKYELEYALTYLEGIYFL